MHWCIVNCEWYGTAYTLEVPTFVCTIQKGVWLNRWSRRWSGDGDFSQTKGFERIKMWPIIFGIKFQVLACIGWRVGTILIYYEIFPFATIDKKSCRIRYKSIFKYSVSSHNRSSRYLNVGTSILGVLSSQILWAKKHDSSNFTIQVCKVGSKWWRAAGSYVELVFFYVGIVF